MKLFMAEDNICAQTLLKLVSHGNAIVAEILRLKDHIPGPYYLESKENQQKYQDVILDFGYFKISDSHEKKICSVSNLQDLDDDLKENFLEIIMRFYLLFENIYQYVLDLNSFVEQLSDDVFIQQNMETVLKDVEGKQLLCESLYLYGAMLLLCDLYIPGQIRERLLVAFYRYSTSQSQSNVDDVCKLLRDTGYHQIQGKRPNDYPVEYFGRVLINYDFIEKIIGKLRSEDIYNQLAVYSIPEHRSAALATQGTMLFVCLFFCPQYLHSDFTKMREVVDKFFPSNWIVSVYMGVTINLVDYWDNFKAAKTALSNTCNNKLIKEIFTKRGSSVATLIHKTHQLLKEGMLTDDFTLINIDKILNLLINSNFVLRWLLLHNSQVTFFDNSKKSRQLKELVQKESQFDPLKLLELLISTAELEHKIREILNRLLDSRTDTWIKSKSQALEATNSLSELFSSSKPISKIPENEQLQLWFSNIAKQISSISDNISMKSSKKIIQLIQALDEVEEFHGIKSVPSVLHLLSECKDALKNGLRIASLKEDFLVTLETVADVSYAWCTIDSYTKYMQNSIKENPAVTSRLRALFLKLASAMEIPLLRINQAQSEDLVSVSQYYSNELIKYIQEVLQVIPEMVFSIVEKIIELQTWSIKEVPTRLEKERLRDYAQLDHRLEVAKLTHSASTFTTGILDMRSTLVGVIRVDPAELLEEGLLKELSKHMNKKFENLLEPQTRKGQTNTSNLLPRLQKLAESMDGYKRSLEYIQDYINIHGLKIWQKQISTIISESVSKEISARKGVAIFTPSGGFMGSLARQILQIIDARTCVYLDISAAWFDLKTQSETVNTKTFAKLGESIGVAGLHALDILYAHMIKNQLQIIQQIFRSNNKDKFLHMKFDDNDILKDIEQTIMRTSKILQQVTDALVQIGSLQILRKHIAYQLNTTAKFDSAHLESSLRTMNEALLNEIKIRTEGKSVPKVTMELIYNLEELSTLCGLQNPYEKVYIRNMTELSNVNLGSILVAIYISNLPKLNVILTTGDLISKKVGENIDGYPLLIGLYSLLCQAPHDHIDDFLSCLCSYVKAWTLSVNKSKTIDNLQEGTNIMKFLEVFCSISHYQFENLEDKLPISLITFTLSK